MNASMLDDFNPSLMNYLGAIVSKFPTSTFQIPISIVRSDYLPTSEHQDMIQNKIDTSEEYINSIDQELQHLQLVASILEKQKQLCQKYSEFHRSLIAPIRKLPCEVLAHIFGHTIDESGIYVYDTANGDFWDLQRVCVRWRNVIRSAPSFWKTIQIFDTISEENIMDPLVTATRMKLCLEHSGGSPLLVSLRPGYKGVFPISIMEDIASHCDRWKHFSSDSHILTDAEKETKINEIITKKGLPMLRKVNICDFDQLYELAPSSKFSFHLFRSASSVEEVDLYGTIIPSVDVFPWANVRLGILKLDRCIISPEHPTTPGSVLGATPLLEELTWSLVNATTDSLDLHSLPVIHLPQLHTITLGGPRSRGSSLHLPRLFIPNLKRLDLHGRVKDFNSLLSSINSSQSTPTRVCLQASSSSFMSRVMEQLPTVEELTIRYPHIENVRLCVVIRKLVRNLDLANTSEATTPNLLPSLQKLHIILPNRKSIQQPIDALLEVMRSRGPRPSLSTTNSEANAQDSAAHLTQVTVGGEIDGDRDYPSVIDKLESVGKEFGIEVKSELLRPVEVSLGRLLAESWEEPGDV